MKKRNAFTLIELLAVIVILAIIALITTTIITKVVENARKNAAKNSALNYLDSVEKYIMYHDVDDTKYPYDLKDNTWNIDDTTTKEISLLNLIPSVKAEEVEVPPLNDFIKVNGSKPTSGTITIDDKGKITNVAMVIQKYNVTCDSSTNCSVEGKDTDPTPVLTIGNVISTKDSITIPYTIDIEKGSAIVECVYGTDENYGQTGVINEKNNTCTLSNLTRETTYYFKLTPKSDKNKKGESKTGEKETEKFYLYNYGNEYTDVTGGWSAEGWTDDPANRYHEYTGTVSSGSKFSNHMEVHGDDTHLVLIGTNSPIDFSGYNKICGYLSLSSPNGGVGGFIWKNKSRSESLGRVDFELVNTSGVEYFETDITNFNSVGYIEFSANQDISRKIDIYSLWLE